MPFDYCKKQSDLPLPFSTASVKKDSADSKIIMIKP